jgi:O-acetyl-ADP-ribose deacetylase
VWWGRVWRGETLGVGRIEFESGDLAQCEADAIVNPANGGFILGFAGVNGALLEAAGEELADECRQLGIAAEGDVRVTGPGRLRCRVVLHAVSPIWHGGAHDEEPTLRQLHLNVAAVAVSHGSRTIALPAVGCGAHRFPPEVAARAAVGAVEEALAAHPELELIRFVFVSEELRRVYARSSIGLAGAGFERTP